MIIGTIIQQPGEALDYDIDYTDFFNSVGGDSDVISASLDFEGNLQSTVTCNPDLQEGTQLLLIRSSDHRLKVWLSGVENNTEYKLTIKMVTHGGRVKEDELIVVGVDF